MAERRGLLNRWRCRRMRASLVDYAEGGLVGSARARLERHAADCGECREAIEALHSVPAMLRAIPAPARDEEFWRRQRQQILRRARQAGEAAPARGWAPRFTWAAGIGAAAVAALVLLLARPTSPPPFEVAAIDGLRAVDVADLADLTEAWSADEEMLDADGLPAEILVSDAGEWMEPPQFGEEPALGELDQEELERLEDLSG